LTVHVILKGERYNRKPLPRVYHRVMKFVLLLACAAVFAQTPRTPAKKAPAKKEIPAPTPAATPSQWPIVSLNVEGNKIFTRDQVLAVAGLKVGQLAGKPEFEAARDRLVASGGFETVGYRFEPGPAKQGYAASFQVVEIQPTFPVEFEDLGVEDKEIEAFLANKDPLFSTKNLPATQTVLSRYVAWVQEYLATKGITEKMAAKVTALTSDRFAILIRPARGLPRVAEVTFSGNQVVPQIALREAIHGVGIGAPYTDAGFREILNLSIRGLYEQRGRVRLKFLEIRTEPVKDVDGVAVFVKLDEGESYNLGNVTIAGPTPIEPKALLKTGDIKTGDIANFDKVHEGIERMRQAVRRAGYLQAKATPVRKINDEKKTVDVEVQIEPGAQYRMGKLTLAGLDLNGEAEMHRMWTMEEGKPFNPDYPNHFLDRIREQGLFDNLGKTKAESKVDDTTHVADVTLTFGGAGEGVGRPK
jgi:outer membrane protein assembly factor BamA